MGGVVQLILQETQARMGVRSGPVSSRQNEKRNRLQREMSVKEKGERERCGSEASGLTAGKGEREGRILGLKELHRGSAGLVGNPKQRSPVQGILHWAPTCQF